MWHIDLKVQLVVAITILLTTSEKVETILRFTLLILSIIYTIYRLVDRFEEKKKKNLNNQDLTSTDDEEHERL